MFNGGEDNTICRMSHWIDEFETDKPAIRDAVQAIRKPHQLFHEALKKIKTAYSQGEILEMRPKSGR